MAQQPDGRFRRFLRTTPGWVLLLLLTIGVVFASWAYIQFVIAIPAVLLFGLGIPIWAGLKRPRFLALFGLVVVVAVAPLVTVIYTQELMTPIGPSASIQGSVDTTSFSVGTPLMQNASVHPYVGSTNTNFTWTVTVFPTHHPLGNTTPVELDLYVSTCPGATGNSSPYCSQPYPFVAFENKSLPPDATQPYTVTFHYRIGSLGVWDWQMGIYTNNTTTKKAFYQLLVGDPTYNGIEGPVVGTFADIYGTVLPDLFFSDLLLIGAPFYCILLIYMLFKQRERRRKEAQERAMGPVPTAPGGTPPAGGTSGAPLPSSKGPSTAATAAPPSGPAVQELNCPNCNAVVYAGEQTCWKCGKSLPGKSS